MIVKIITERMKCDTVTCNQDAICVIYTNNYKGNLFLCGECFEKYRKLFKESMYKNEKKQN